MPPAPVPSEGSEDSKAPSVAEQHKKQGQQSEQEKVKAKDQESEEEQQQPVKENSDPKPFEEEKEQQSDELAAPAASPPAVVPTAGGNLQIAAEGAKAGGSEPQLEPHKNSADGSSDPQAVATVIATAASVATAGSVGDGGAIASERREEEKHGSGTDNVVENGGRVDVTRGGEEGSEKNDQGDQFASVAEASQSDKSAGSSSSNVPQGEPQDEPQGEKGGSATATSGNVSATEAKEPTQGPVAGTGAAGVAGEKQGKERVKTPVTGRKKQAELLKSRFFAKEKKKGTKKSAKQRLEERQQARQNEAKGEARGAGKRNLSKGSNKKKGINRFKQAAKRAIGAQKAASAFAFIPEGVVAQNIPDDDSAMTAALGAYAETEAAALPGAKRKKKSKRDIRARSRSREREKLAAEGGGGVRFSATEDTGEPNSRPSSRPASASILRTKKVAEEKALQRHLAEVEREQAVEQGTAAQRAENDRLADDLHGHVEEMERDRDAKVQQGAPTYFVQMVPKEAEPPFVMLEPDKDESEAESDLEDENAVKREGPAEDGQDDKVKKLIEKDGFDYRGLLTNIAETKHNRMKLVQTRPVEVVDSSIRILQGRKGKKKIDSVELLVKVASKHDVRAMQHSSKGFAQFALEEEGREALAYFQGGAAIEAMFRLIDSDDKETQQHCVFALACVASTSRLRATLGMLGTVEVLVDLAVSERCSERSRRACCFALLHLAADEDARLTFIDLVPDILSLLDSPDPDIVRFTALCLQNMLGDHRMFPHVVQHGGLGSLIAVMVGDHVIEETLLHVIFCLQIISISDPVKMLLLKENMFDLILAVKTQQEDRLEREYQEQFKVKSDFHLGDRQRAIDKKTLLKYVRGGETHTLRTLTELYALLANIATFKETHPLLLDTDTEGKKPGARARVLFDVLRDPPDDPDQQFHVANVLANMCEDAINHKLLHKIGAFRRILELMCCTDDLTRTTACRAVSNAAVHIASQEDLINAGLLDAALTELLHGDSLLSRTFCGVFLSLLTENDQLIDYLSTPVVLDKLLILLFHPRENQDGQITRYVCLAVANLARHLPVHPRLISEAVHLGDEEFLAPCYIDHPSAREHFALLLSNLATNPNAHGILTSTAVMREAASLLRFSDEPGALMLIAHNLHEMGYAPDGTEVTSLGDRTRRPATAGSTVGDMTGRDSARDTSRRGNDTARSGAESTDYDDMESGEEDGESETDAEGNGDTTRRRRKRMAPEAMPTSEVRVVRMAMGFFFNLTVDDATRAAVTDAIFTQLMALCLTLDDHRDLLLCISLLADLSFNSNSHALVLQERNSPLHCIVNRLLRQPMVESKRGVLTMLARVTTDEPLRGQIATSPCLPLVLAYTHSPDGPTQALALRCVSNMACSPFALPLLNHSQVERLLLPCLGSPYLQCRKVAAVALGNFASHLQSDLNLARHPRDAAFISKHIIKLTGKDDFATRAAVMEELIPMTYLMSNASLHDRNHGLLMDASVDTLLLKVMIRIMISSPNAQLRRYSAQFLQNITTTAHNAPLCADSFLAASLMKAAQRETDPFTLLCIAGTMRNLAVSINNTDKGLIRADVVQWCLSVLEMLPKHERLEKEQEEQKKAAARQRMEVEGAAVEAPEDEVGRITSTDTRALMEMEVSHVIDNMARGHGTAVDKQCCAGMIQCAQTLLLRVRELRREEEENYNNALRAGGELDDGDDEDDGDDGGDEAGRGEDSVTWGNMIMPTSAAPSAASTPRTVQKKKSIQFSFDEQPSAQSRPNSARKTATPSILKRQSSGRAPIEDMRDKAGKGKMEKGNISLLQLPKQKSMGNLAIVAEDPQGDAIKVYPGQSAPSAPTSSRRSRTPGAPTPNPNLPSAVLRNRKGGKKKRKAKGKGKGIKTLKHKIAALNGGQKLDANELMRIKEQYLRSVQYIAEVELCAFSCLGALLANEACQRFAIEKLALFHFVDHVLSRSVPEPVHNTFAWTIFRLLSPTQTRRLLLSLVSEDWLFTTCSALLSTKVGILHTASAFTLASCLGTTPTLAADILADPRAPAEAQAAAYAHLSKVPTSVQIASSMHAVVATTYGLRAATDRFLSPLSPPPPALLLQILKIMLDSVRRHKNGMNITPLAQLCLMTLAQCSASMRARAAFLSPLGRDSIKAAMGMIKNGMPTAQRSAALLLANLASLAASQHTRNSLRNDQVGQTARQVAERSGAGRWWSFWKNATERNADLLVEQFRDEMKTERADAQRLASAREQARTAREALGDGAVTDGPPIADGTPGATQRSSMADKAGGHVGGLVSILVHTHQTRNKLGEVEDQMKLSLETLKLVRQLPLPMVVYLLESNDEATRRLAVGAIESLAQDESCARILLREPSVVHVLAAVTAEAEERGVGLGGAPLRRHISGALLNLVSSTLPLQGRAEEADKKVKKKFKTVPPAAYVALVKPLLRLGLGTRHYPSPASATTDSDPKHPRLTARSVLKKKHRTAWAERPGSLWEELEDWEEEELCRGQVALCLARLFSAHIPGVAEECCQNADVIKCMSALLTASHNGFLYLHTARALAHLLSDRAVMPAVLSPLNWRNAMAGLVAALCRCLPRPGLASTLKIASAGYRAEQVGGTAGAAAHGDAVRADRASRDAVLEDQARAAAAGDAVDVEEEDAMGFETRRWGKWVDGAWVSEKEGGRWEDGKWTVATARHQRDAQREEARKQKKRQRPRMPPADEVEACFYAASSLHSLSTLPLMCPLLASTGGVAALLQLSLLLPWPAARLLHIAGGVKLGEQQQLNMASVKEQENALDKEDARAAALLQGQRNDNTLVAVTPLERAELRAMQAKEEAGRKRQEEKELRQARLATRARASAALHNMARAPPSYKLLLRHARTPLATAVLLINLSRLSVPPPEGNKASRKPARNKQVTDADATPFLPLMTHSLALTTLLWVDHTFFLSCVRACSSLPVAMCLLPCLPHVRAVCPLNSPGARLILRLLTRLSQHPTAMVHVPMKRWVDALSVLGGGLGSQFDDKGNEVEIKQADAKPPAPAPLIVDGNQQWRVAAGTSHVFVRCFNAQENFKVGAKAKLLLSWRDAGGTIKKFTAFSSVFYEHGFRVAFQSAVKAKMVGSTLLATVQVEEGVPSNAIPVGKVDKLVHLGDPVRVPIKGQLRGREGKVLSEDDRYFHVELDHLATATEKQKKKRKKVVKVARGQECSIQLLGGGASEAAQRARKRWRRAAGKVIAALRFGLSTLHLFAEEEKQDESAWLAQVAQRPTAKTAAQEQSQHDLHIATVVARLCCFHEEGKPPLPPPPQDQNPVTGSLAAETYPTAMFLSHPSAAEASIAQYNWVGVVQLVTRLLQSKDTAVCALAMLAASGLPVGSKSPKAGGGAGSGGGGFGEESEGEQAPPLARLFSLVDNVAGRLTALLQAADLDVRVLGALLAVRLLQRPHNAVILLKDQGFKPASLLNCLSKMSAHAPANPVAARLLLLASTYLTDHLLPYLPSNTPLNPPRSHKRHTSSTLALFCTVPSKDNSDQRLPYTHKLAITRVRAIMEVSGSHLDALAMLTLPTYVTLSTEGAAAGKGKKGKKAAKKPVSLQKWMGSRAAAKLRCYYAADRNRVTLSDPCHGDLAASSSSVPSNVAAAEQAKAADQENEKVGQGSENTYTHLIPSAADSHPAPAATRRLALTLLCRFSSLPALHSAFASAPRAVAALVALASSNDPSLPSLPVRRLDEKPPGFMVFTRSRRFALATCLNLSSSPLCAPLLLRAGLLTTLMDFSNAPKTSFYFSLAAAAQDIKAALQAQRPLTTRRSLDFSREPSAPLTSRRRGGGEAAAEEEGAEGKEGGQGWSPTQPMEKRGVVGGGATSSASKSRAMRTPQHPTPAVVVDWDADEGQGGGGSAAARSGAPSLVLPTPPTVPMERNHHAAQPEPASACPSASPAAAATAHRSPLPGRLPLEGILRRGGPATGHSVRLASGGGGLGDVITAGAVRGAEYAALLCTGNFEEEFPVGQGGTQEETMWERERLGRRWRGSVRDAKQEAREEVEEAGSQWADVSTYKAMTARMLTRVLANGGSEVDHSLAVNSEEANALNKQLLEAVSKQRQAQAAAQASKAAADKRKGKKGKSLWARMASKLVPQRQSEEEQAKRRDNKLAKAAKAMVAQHARRERERGLLEENAKHREQRAKDEEEQERVAKRVEDSRLLELERLSASACALLQTGADCRALCSALAQQCCHRNFQCQVLPPVLLERLLILSDSPDLPTAHLALSAVVGCVLGAVHIDTAASRAMVAEGLRPNWRTSDSSSIVRDLLKHLMSDDATVQLLCLKGLGRLLESPVHRSTVVDIHNTTQQQAYSQATPVKSPYKSNLARSAMAGGSVERPNPLFRLVEVSRNKDSRMQYALSHIALSLAKLPSPLLFALSSAVLPLFANLVLQPQEDICVPAAHALLGFVADKGSEGMGPRSFLLLTVADNGNVGVRAVLKLLDFPQSSLRVPAWRVLREIAAHPDMARAVCAAEGVQRVVQLLMPENIAAEAAGSDKLSNKRVLQAKAKRMAQRKFKSPAQARKDKERAARGEGLGHLQVSRLNLPPLLPDIGPLLWTDSSGAEDPLAIVAKCLSGVCADMASHGPFVEQGGVQALVALAEEENPVVQRDAMQALAGVVPYCTVSALDEGNPPLPMMLRGLRSLIVGNMVGQATEQGTARGTSRGAAKGGAKGKPPRSSRVDPLQNRAKGSLRSPGRGAATPKASSAAAQRSVSAFLGLGQRQNPAATLGGAGAEKERARSTSSKLTVLDVGVRALVRLCVTADNTTEVALAPVAELAAELLVAVGSVYGDPHAPPVLIALQLLQGVLLLLAKLAPFPRTSRVLLRGAWDVIPIVEDQGTDPLFVLLSLGRRSEVVFKVAVSELLLEIIKASVANERAKQPDPDAASLLIPLAMRGALPLLARLCQFPDAVVKRQATQALLLLLEQDHVLDVLKAHNAKRPSTAHRRLRDKNYSPRQSSREGNTSSRIKLGGYPVSAGFDADPFTPRTARGGSPKEGGGDKPRAYLTDKERKERQELAKKKHEQNMKLRVEQQQRKRFLQLDGPAAQQIMLMSQMNEDPSVKSRATKVMIRMAGTVSRPLSKRASRMLSRQATLARLKSRAAKHVSQHDLLLQEHEALLSHHAKLQKDHEQVTQEKEHLEKELNKPPPEKKTVWVEAQQHWVQEDDQDDGVHYLTLDPDDLIRVVDATDPEWWLGKLGSETGLFPKFAVRPVKLITTYVEDIPDYGHA